MFSLQHLRGPCVLRSEFILVDEIEASCSSASLSFQCSYSSVPKFVNLLRSPGIDYQPGGPVRQPYLTWIFSYLSKCFYTYNMGQWKYDIMEHYGSPVWKYKVMKRITSGSPLWKYEIMQHVMSGWPVWDYEISYHVGVTSLEIWNKKVTCKLAHVVFRLGRGR